MTLVDISLTAKTLTLETPISATTGYSQNLTY